MLFEDSQEVTRTDTAKIYVTNFSLAEIVFTHVAAVGNMVLCIVTSQLGIDMSPHPDIKIPCLHCDCFFNLHQKLTFSRILTSLCHEIDAMTFAAECHENYFVGPKTNIKAEDLENAIIIFSGTAARSQMALD